MADEIPNSIGEIKPFNPERDILVSDLRLIERSWKESVAQGRANIFFARDIITCFPERRVSLNIPRQVIDDEIQSIEVDVPNVLIDLDMVRILDRASTLKQLFPDLDPQTFNKALFLGRPFLDYERQSLINQQEHAQRDRKKEAPPPNPLWFRAESITRFAHFQIITEGTPLALSLGPQDMRDGISYFKVLAETKNPKFSTREEYVARALGIGADLRILFPEIQLPVKPEFWAEAHALMNKTRNEHISRGVIGLMDKDILKGNLPQYMRYARQATILGRQTE